MIADRAHCAVWDLDTAPSWWVERIRLALSAENEAAHERAVRDERRQRRQSATHSTSSGRRR